MNENTKSEV